MTLEEKYLALDAVLVSLECPEVNPEIKELCERLQDLLESHFYQNYEKKGLSHQQFLEDQINALEALSASPAIFGGLV
jgi:hypothetical protein